MIGTKGLKPVDRESQETCINIYKIEDYAKVYTCEPAMLKRMQAMAERDPDNVKVLSSDGYAVTYRVPKNYVSVRIARKGRTIVLSEDGKLRRLEALAKARAARIKSEP